MQHLGQGPGGPPSGYLEWSIWWGWGWGGGYEPVHLLACNLPSACPGTEPSVGRSQLENVHLGVNTSLGCGPCEVLVQKAAVPLVPKLITLQHFDAEGGDLDAECSIWAKAPVSRPAAI